jgi:hypothetical protein
MGGGGGVRTGRGEGVVACRIVGHFGKGTGEVEEVGGTAREERNGQDGGGRWSDSFRVIQVFSMVKCRYCYVADCGSQSWSNHSSPILGSLELLFFEIRELGAP